MVDGAAAKAETRRCEALLKDIQILNERLTEERIRAENAIDQLIAKSGAAPVTPTRLPDPNTYPGVFDEDPDVLQEMREDIKLSGIDKILKQSLGDA